MRAHLGQNEFWIDILSVDHLMQIPSATLEAHLQKQFPLQWEHATLAPSQVYQVKNLLSRSIPLM